MRLGDLDALFCRFWGKADPFKEQPLVRPCTVWSDAAAMAREAPTIDPETIPVVRQLREELEIVNSRLHGVTAERDAMENVLHGNCSYCKRYNACRSFKECHGKEE